MCFRNISLATLRKIHSVFFYLILLVQCTNKNDRIWIKKKKGTIKLQEGYKCQYETFKTSTKHEMAVYFPRANVNIYLII